SVSEIKGYEIVYQRASGATEITIDNDGGGFTKEGTGLGESTSVSGYVGDNYLAVARGGGETKATWSFTNLEPGITYSVDAIWTSASNRASNAAYQLQYCDAAGNFVDSLVELDQRQNGGEWQVLENVVPVDSECNVTVTNDADGYVIVHAVRVSPQVADPQTIIVNDPTATSYIVKDLAPGNWSFQMRVVDTDNVKSDLSETQVKVVK